MTRRLGKNVRWLVMGLSATVVSESRMLSQSLGPAWPQTGQPAPEKPISRTEVGSLDGWLVDGQRMS